MKSANTKIYYLDNLKVFLVALVVAHHAAQGYQLGELWLIPDPDQTKWLALLISTNATFFMGLFFFISGYFLPRSCEKTTRGTLFKKKVMRLGVPALCTVLFILPPTYYVSEYNQHESFIHFLTGWFFTKEHFTFGHTWFIMQLLFYSSIYIALCPKRAHQVAISNSRIVLYTVALFVSTWLVSLKFPNGEWYFYHLVEPFHLPQYISLFAAGIMAYKSNWLHTVSPRMGYTWLGIGSICFAILVVLKAANIGFSPIGYTLWSSIMCSSFCVGLLTLFRECCNVQTPLLQFLAKNGYTVYLVHVLPVICVQRLLLPYSFGGMLKFFIAFVVSYIASYMLAALLRFKKE